MNGRLVFYDRGGKFVNIIWEISPTDAGFSGANWYTCYCRNDIQHALKSFAQRKAVITEFFIPP